MTATGGRPALIDRTRIVEAAFAIGIDEASMHAIARYLGVSATALYRHVASRDDLLDACMDEFCERVGRPDTTLPWQDYLRALSAAFRAALKATPGAAQYGFKVGQTTPSAYQIFDEALGVLYEAGFTSEGAWRSYALVVDHAFTFSEKMDRMAELVKEQGPGGYRVFQLEGESLAAFPHLARALPDMLSTDFERGFAAQTETLIAGIAADLAPR